MSNMGKLELTAINKYGEEIKSECAISTIYQEIAFSYKGTQHTIKYKQSRNGNYFILKGIRYYFKVYDNFYNKWVLDCACF